MSETSQKTVVSAINRLTGIIQIQLNRLIQAVVNNTKWISRLLTIGRKNLHKSAVFKGMNKGEIASILGAIQAPGGPAAAKGIQGPSKKTVSNTKKFFGKMGKSMAGMLKGSAQMALISLAMEPLSAMISAFLEPMEMLTPLFEAWGSILSQLLIPIVAVLLEILMPLTPAFIAIVNALMPLILLLVSVVGWLVPIIQVVAQVIVMLSALINISTQMIGWLTIVSEGVRALLDILSGFFITIYSTITTFFTGIGQIWENLWSSIWTSITTNTGALVDIIEDTWNDITGIFRTKETGGIW